MDSPPLLAKPHDRDPGGKTMRDILRFARVELATKHRFGSVVLSSEEKRTEWLETADALGVKDSG